MNSQHTTPSRSASRIFALASSLLLATALPAAAQTVASFSSTVTIGGTGCFTGTSVTFTAGAFSDASLTPIAAGDYLTLTAPDGVSGKTGSTTIGTIQTRHAAWAGGAAFDADSNDDGLDSGLAFLLDANLINVEATIPAGAATPGTKLFGRLEVTP